MAGPCDGLDLQLMAYADGEATADEHERIEAHLATCERCRNRVEEWRTLSTQANRSIARLGAAYGRRARPPIPVPVLGPPRSGGRAAAVLGAAVCLAAIFLVQLTIGRQGSFSRAAVAPAVAAATATPLAQAVAATPVAAIATPAAPVVSLATATPATPAPAATDDLAFVRSGDLWLHQASGDVQLTQSGPVIAPRWSSTRRWLLYETTGATGKLWLRQWGGQEAEPLPEPASSGLARWSPAADELVVARHDGSLWLVQPRGGSPRPLLAGGGQITNLTWSPDGNELAVERRGVGPAPQSLWLVTRGGVITALPAVAVSSAPATSGESAASTVRSTDSVPVLGSWAPVGRTLNVWWSPAPLQSPTRLPMAIWPMGGAAQTVLPSVYTYRDFVSWAPDGHALAAVASMVEATGAARTGQLVIVPVAPSGSPRVLRDPGRSDGDVAWSPDGKSIAYASSVVDPHGADAASGRQIWVTAPDGSARRPVTPGPLDQFPEWSRDGGELLYVHQVAEHAELWVVSRDGQGAHRIVDGLVSMNDLPKQSFGASGLVSYRGIFAWADAYGGE